MFLSLSACAEKAFVGAPESNREAQLGLVIGLGEFQDGDVTGVRIRVTFEADQIESLYDQVIPYALEVPARDFQVPLDIGPCLRALAVDGVQPTECPVLVIVDILAGTRVLARDILPPISISAGQTITTEALGARTATSLRLQVNGGAVPDLVELTVGEAATVTATVFDANDVPIAGREISWESNAQTVATVSSDGVITAVGAGTALIVARTGEGEALLQEAVSVQVTGRPIANLTVTPNPATVNIGGTQQLTVVASDNTGTVVATPSLTWESSANAVATVSGTGVVTGVSSGSATITARTSNGITGTTIVTSGRPATLTVTPSPLTLQIGGTQQLTVVAKDAGGTIVPAPALTWQTTSAAIATVSGTGLVTAVAPGTATITASNASLSISGTISVSVTGNARIYGQVRNALTNVPVAGATIRVTRSGNTTPLTQQSAADGSYNFTGLVPGAHIVEALQTGFKTQSASNTQLTQVAAGDVARIDFDLPPSNSFQRFGGIAGRIMRVDGTPIPNISVTLSGGEQTNGVFRATTTGADGTYAFAGIVLDDPYGFPISSFTVGAEGVGFSPSSRSTPVTENAVVPNLNLTLAPAGPVTTWFSDGFETSSGWEGTDLWNRSTLVGITNGAFPMYVSLAPDDNSNGALPAPASGMFAYWFGTPQATGTERGNFLGTHIGPEEDFPKSGGTSMTPVMGTLTSPIITVPSNTPRVTLRFDSWFEIESNQPNQEGFDLMEVYVRVFPDSYLYQVHRLNPFSDPTLPDRDAIPYTSGGFNRAPIWRTVEVNLDEFKGYQIQVVFHFNTVDGQYNGFRGWIIDNVSVSDRMRSQEAPPPHASDMVQSLKKDKVQRRRGR